MPTFELCPEPPAPDQLLINRAATLPTDERDYYRLGSDLKIHRISWNREVAAAEYDHNTSHLSLSNGMVREFIDIALDEGDSSVSVEANTRRALSAVALSRMIFVTLPLRPFPREHQPEHILSHVTDGRSEDIFPERSRGETGRQNDYVLHVHSAFSERHFGETSTNAVNWYYKDGLYVRREAAGVVESMHPAAQAEIAARGVEADYTNMYSLFPYLADARQLEP